MADDAGESLSSGWPEIVRRIRVRTPARLLTGRSGGAYRTGTQIDLREAHAAARDAVRTELDLERDFGPAFIERWKLLELSSRAKSKDEYLLRPDLGRAFNDQSQEELKQRCPSGRKLQIAIGDGLSVTAVSAQVPGLLPLLYEGANARGWTVGQTFAIRYCRVGILNEIGELLSPEVAVLLIGERPGLATAESLSAYLAFRPQLDHSDANRNLISNIHARGVSLKEAAARILHLAERIMNLGASGCQLREELSPAGLPPPITP
jgi:ethanolamine ammonia-lyase small subunit